MVGFNRMKMACAWKNFPNRLRYFSFIGVDYILCVAILSIFFCRKAFSFFIFQLITVKNIFFWNKFSGHRGKFSWKPSASQDAIPFLSCFPWSKINLCIFASLRLNSKIFSTNRYFFVNPFALCKFSLSLHLKD